MTSVRTSQQDVVAAKNKIAELKSLYMAALNDYIGVTNASKTEALAKLLECQKRGNAYFNYAEEFVGNSSLLGAHVDSLWAQGFAEDCAELLKSLPQHVELLREGFKKYPDVDLKIITPGNTAYANMQRMVVKYLTSNETEEVRNALVNANIPTYGFTNDAKEFMSRKLQTMLAFIFGVSFVLLLIIISFIEPNPSSFQYTVFRVVLALAGGGAVAVFPGFIELKVGNWLRAGGALAVFAVIYFYNPALQKEKPISPELPKRAETGATKNRKGQNNETKNNSGASSSINIDRSNNVLINQTQNAKDTAASVTASGLKQSLKSLDSIESYVYSSIDLEPDHYQSLLSRTRNEIRNINEISGRTHDFIMKTYDCYHNAGGVWKESSPPALMKKGLSSSYDDARITFQKDTLPRLSGKWKDCSALLKTAHEYFEMEP